MKIKIFMLTANSNHERKLLLSFGHSIKQWSESRSENTGYARIGRWKANESNSVEFEYGDSYVDCDLAVMFGSWKAREKGHHVVRNSVALNARRFICIETPLLARKTDRINQYWRMGVNGFLSQGAYWPMLDSEIAQSRLDALNINWAGWNSNPNGHIVLALQLPGDASLRGADINDWAYNSIMTIRSVTDRPIIVRNHPLASQRAFVDHGELAMKLMINHVPNLTFSDGSVVPWSRDLDNAYCTVTYTSGLAVDSIVAGVPTVACDPGNFAWDISTNFVEDIENLKLAKSEQVHQWLEQLSMCQWHVDEMKNGTAWEHLLPVVESIE